MQKRAESVQKPEPKAKSGTFDQARRLGYTHTKRQSLEPAALFRVDCEFLGAGLIEHGLELIGGSLLHSFEYVLIGVGRESDRAVPEALANDFKLLVRD